MRETINFRPETDEDLQFLCFLYISTRAEEMAMVPWTDEQKVAFLMQQFAAQRSHYHANYDGAEYLVVLENGDPGLMRIALDEHFAGQGRGTFLPLAGCVPARSSTLRRPFRRRSDRPRIPSIPFPPSRGEGDAAARSRRTGRAEEREETGLGLAVRYIVFLEYPASAIDVTPEVDAEHDARPGQCVGRALDAQTRNRPRRSRRRIRGARHRRAARGDQGALAPVAYA